MTITATGIITLGAVLTALGVIVKIFATVYEFVRHNNEQDLKIEQIQEKQKQQSVEMALILDGVLATLDGLEQQGCNHTVPSTRQKLHDYINEQAHK